jgi:hypothetical protein
LSGTALGIRSPVARAFIEVLPECTRKSFSGTEPDFNGDIQYGLPGAMNEHACSDIQSAAAEIVADSFAHPDREQTMKMERREVGDTCELGNLERIAQMCINMVKYPI